MKKPTTLLIIVALNVFCIHAGAQTLGLKAGLNLSSMLDKTDEITYSDEYMVNPAYHLGATVNFTLSERSSIETGLFYSKKGYKFESERVANTLLVTAEITYVDIPIIFKVKTNFEGDFQIFSTAGPYLGIGLKGNIISEGEKAGTSNYALEKVVWGNNEYNSNLKRLEYGLTLGGGVEYSYFSLGASYMFGINNIAVSQDDGAVIKNRVVMISLGWRFGKYYVM